MSIVKRGQRQGIFRQIDPLDFARLFTSATDGAGIKILASAPELTVDSMRDLLVSLVDTLIVA